MSPYAFLFLLLVCGLASAPCRAQVDDRALRPEDIIPMEEWSNDDRVAASSNGRGPTLEEVRAEIENLNHVYSTHVRNDNCGALINLYDPHVMLISRNGVIHKGLEAIQLTMSILENVAEMNMATIAVSPLGREAKFVFHHANATAYDRQGHVMWSGESFLIWKRHHDGLKIHVELYDADA